MMIKWILLATTSLMMINTAHADNKSWCGYKDSFRINSISHPDIYIVRGYSDLDVILQVTSPRTFVLRDAPQCKQGFVHLEIADGQNNWCIIDIKDGPWINHPPVNVSCGGMRYIATDYDGFNTYSYTINLD